MYLIGAAIALSVLFVLVCIIARNDREGRKSNEGRE